MSSWGSSLLLGPKKLQNQQFYIIDWIREKTPGRCCQSGYLLLWWLWCTIGGLGTLRKCYVSSPVAKALVLDWKSWLAHNCFLDVFLGLQHQQFYKIDWIRKKPLVKVANLATCCHDDSDVLLEVLGTLRECYVSSLLGLTTFPPKEKTPGRCCQSGYLLLWWLWCTIGGLGTLRKCYVSSPVAKTLVLDWKSWLAQVVLGCLPGAHSYWAQKSFKINNFI